MWLLPALLILAAIACSIPLSAYFAWLMDGTLPRAARPQAGSRTSLDTGPQDWKQYTIALVVFNIALFVFGFVVLCLQPIAPLNPLGLGMLEPTTIFNTVISFMTNTNLQHYSGDQHLSNFSQIFFILPNMFLSASVGFCALAAIIRAFRGESDGRQLLRRYVAGRDLHLRAGRADVRRHLHAAGHADDLRQRRGRHDPRAGLDGPRRQGPGEAANDHRRPGRRRHPDQDARHQRRRLLRHELRPSAGEPDRDDQLLHHAGDDAVPVRAGADVRAHAQAHPALGRHLRRHARDDDRADRLGRSAPTRWSRTPASPRTPATA